MYEAIDSLKSEISSHGMVPPDHFEPGKMVRFSDDGGKNKNGYCEMSMQIGELERLITPGGNR